MAQNVKKEINFLEKHISKDKDSVLFARLADKRLENDEVEKAIQICEQGLQKYPYYVTGHLVMAKCYLAASFKKEAKEELHRVLTFDNNNIAANRLLSVLLEEEGDKTSVLEHRKAIILADPMNKDSESISKDLGAQAPVTEEVAVAIEPESTILEEAAVEEETLSDEGLEDFADVVSEVEIGDEGAAVEETTVDTGVPTEEGALSEAEIEVSPEDILTQPAADTEEPVSEMREEEVAAEETEDISPEELEAVAAEDETIAFPEEETVSEEVEEAVLEDKKAVEHETEESVIDEELDKMAAEEEVESMQESEVEPAMEEVTVEPESEIEEEIDLEVEGAAAADELVEEEIEVQSLDDTDMDEIEEITPADIKEEEIESVAEEVPEVEEDEIEVSPEETSEVEVHPEAELGEEDISFEEYMESDEEIDVKFDEDEEEHLDEPVIKSLDLEKDFEIHESLEAEKQIPPAECGGEEPLDLETEEVEVEPESAEEMINDKETDLEYDELASMIEKEGVEALKKEEEEFIDLDAKAPHSAGDEESEEVDVSPAKRDELAVSYEDKKDFSEFLKEDFIEDIDFEDSSLKKSGELEDIEEDIDVSPDEKADEDTVEDIEIPISEEEIKSAIGVSASGGEDISLEEIDDLVPIDFDEEDIGGEIATMTLSEIYISQSKYDKALQVLEILKSKEPDNPKIDEKIKEIEKNMNA